LIGTLIFRLIEYFVQIGLLKYKSKLNTPITFLRILLCKLQFQIMFHSWTSLFIIDPFHNNTRVITYIPCFEDRAPKNAIIIYFLYNSSKQ